MGDDQADQSASTYSFGETKLAAERLRVFSEVFNPTREAFVSEAVRKRLIYARFLASHLPQPEEAISGWAKRLKAGGLLLLEEVDSINTAVAAFDEYLKIVSEVLAQHGNELFVGARLASTRWDDLRIEVNRASEVRSSTGQAAKMFSMNLSNWRHDPARDCWP